MNLPKTFPILVLFLALGAWATDELTTEIKPAGPTTVPGPAAQPSTTSDKLPAGKKLDPALRAQIRKRAPFWIQDANHGAAIQINKDGTFTSESQGGGSIAGQWRAFRGEIFISWSDGGEQYGYPVKVIKSGITIHGHTAKKNRFIISGH